VGQQKNEGFKVQRFRVQRIAKDSRFWVQGFLVKDFHCKANRQLRINQFDRRKNSFQLPY